MKKIVRILGVIAATIAFEAFFWQESLGINALLYTVLIYGFIFYLNPKSIRSLNVLITAIGTLTLAVLVVYHNSGTSKFAFICSFIVTLGFVFQPSLRSVLTSWSAGFLNFFIAPGFLVLDLKSGGKKNKKRKTSFWKWFNLFILPIIILLVFFFIFKGANPVFHEYTAKYWNEFVLFLEELFINLTWLQFIFTLTGLFLAIGFIYKTKLDFISKSEAKKDVNITREKIKQKNRPGRFRKLLALRNENRRAVILVVMINVLVLIINVIDINWIWFNFELRENMDLKQLVHEGTYLLILSILLSMGIILFFFRGNLNFFRNNKILRYGAYAWLFQNIIMIVSVLIRNYHYIHYFGLAYKRIGVIIFLILTIIGIVTIFIKIAKNKSGFYLIKTNAWAAFIMMLSISFFNWDIIITKHNLNHQFPQNMEADFLMRMSDNTLHILYENHEKFATEPFLKNNGSLNYLKYRINKLQEDKQEQTWLSWTLAEEKAYNSLIEQSKN